MPISNRRGCCTSRQNSGFFSPSRIAAAIGPPIGRRSIGRSAARHTGIISGREVGTTAIALLPTYEAAGGEYTGSVVHLVETAPPGRRGFAGSMANIGSASGVLLASAVRRPTRSPSKAFHFSCAEMPSTLKSRKISLRFQPRLTRCMRMAFGGHIVFAGMTDEQPRPEDRRAASWDAE
jgi:hypothetical protein